MLECSTKSESSQEDSRSDNEREEREGAKQAKWLQDFWYLSLEISFLVTLKGVFYNFFISNFLFHNSMTNSVVPDQINQIEIMKNA